MRKYQTSYEKLLTGAVIISVLCVALNLYVFCVLLRVSFSVPVDILKLRIYYFTTQLYICVMCCYNEIQLKIIRIIENILKDQVIFFTIHPAFTVIKVTASWFCSYVIVENNQLFVPNVQYILQCIKSKQNGGI